MISRVKTTLDIDDALVTRAKIAAARRRTTLTRLVEEGLRLRLAEPRRATAARVVLPVFNGGGGMRPGIDPCSNRSMLDAADGDDDA